MFSAAALLDARNGPAYDTPPQDHPVRWAVIAATPRTGSTLLARLLTDSGRVGHVKEYLNPTQLRDWELRFGSLPSKLRHLPLRGPALALVGRLPWSERRLHQHLRRVSRYRAGPSGQVVLKVHHHHWVRAFRAEPAPTALPGLRIIRIRRQDRLAQAISWARARQTGRWAAHQSGFAPPVYRRAAITRALRRIEHAEAGWDTIIGDRPCLDLSYEGLIADPLKTTNAALDYLGEDPVVDVTLGLARQADASSRAWRERYLSGR